MSRSEGERCFWPALLSVLGIGVWFSLGFPFAHHNESFRWAALIDKAGPIASMTPEMTFSRTYRPLGQAVAVGSYLASGSIVPVQVFNFGVAALSLALLVCSTNRPLTAGLLAAVVFGVFFPGFIYLFHLHGVFYSPVLLLLVLFLRLYPSPGSGSRSTDALAWTAALAASLFHPYALLLFAAFLSGALLERHLAGSLRAAGLAWGGGLLVATTLLVVVMVPAGVGEIGEDNLGGWLATFRGTEVHWVSAVVAVVLAVFTLQDLPRSPLARAGVALFVLLACACAGALGVPVVSVWLVACAARAAWMGCWSLAAVLAMTLLLPAISPTGSPTYAVFGLFAAVAAMANGNDLMPELPRSWVRAATVGAFVGAAALVLILRSGYRVPVVYSFANPLLAEREKTFQLQEIVDWWNGSEYRTLRLRLYRDPAESSQSGLGSRRYRPPTYQEYLDLYAHVPAGAKSGELVVTFGGDALDGEPLVKGVEGRFAGPAAVYLMDAR